MGEIIPFWKAFLEATQHTGISPFLLAAIGWAESRWDPMAVSPRGAKGIMQLMPFVWDKWGDGQIHDPGDNILAGAKYLRFLMALCDRWKKDEIKWSLAAYAWGLGNVRKTENWEDVPEEVRRYTELIEKKSKELFIQHYIRELALGVFYDYDGREVR